MPRKKINYLDLIRVLDYQKEFDLYCLNHRDISLKRNAYNFCRSFGLCFNRLKLAYLNAIMVADSIDTSEIGDVVYGEPKGRPF